MSINRLLLPSAQPEWQRSGRFFAGAIVLHLLVLCYPLHSAVGQLDAPASSTVMVRLVEAVRALPVAPPQPAPPVPPASRERSRPTPRPILAVAAEPVAAPAAFSVPAAVPAPAAAAERPAAPAALSLPVSVTAARVEAAYQHNPRPNYPALSRRLGEEGKVMLKVRVGADGQALAVDIEKSSNFTRLDEAARQEVGRWRFVPAKRGDEAIEASVLVPIVFRLAD